MTHEQYIKLYEWAIQGKELYEQIERLEQVMGQTSGSPLILAIYRAFSTFTRRTAEAVGAKTERLTWYQYAVKFGISPITAEFENGAKILVKGPEDLRAVIEMDSESSIAMYRIPESELRHTNNEAGSDCRKLFVRVFIAPDDEKPWETIGRALGVASVWPDPFTGEESTPQAAWNWIDKMIGGRKNRKWEDAQRGKYFIANAE